MTDHVSHDTPADLASLRSALRTLPRGDLLIIAERAAELVPRARLGALLGDFMRIDALTRTHTPLLSDVQKFHAAARAGKYFEDFCVTSRNVTQRCAGTDAFIAEFNRLSAKCVRAADAAPSDTVRTAFELLFGLLRHIDEAPDDVVFFADEAGAWQLGVTGRAVFPAYFRCLARTLGADEFARCVDQAIADFADHGRPRYLALARKPCACERCLTATMEVFAMVNSGDGGYWTPDGRWIGQVAPRVDRSNAARRSRQDDDALKALLDRTPNAR